MLKGILIGELKKIDMDKKGGPDVVQALDAIDKGLDAAVELLEKFNSEDIAKLLFAANQIAGGKIAKPEIAKAAVAIAALPAALKQIDAVVEAASKEMKKK